MNYAASLPFPILFFLYSLSSAGHVTSTTTTTRNHYTPSIGLCTTHLDRVKTFVRGVQRDFPESSFSETRNFFVPVQPLLARFGVLPFDEDRRADRRHGGRKLDPAGSTPRPRGAEPRRRLTSFFVSIDRSRRSPAFPSAALGNGGRKVEIPLLWVLGKGGNRWRGTIYLIIWSKKAGCCSCFLLKQIYTKILKCTQATRVRVPAWEDVFTSSHVV